MNDSYVYPAVIIPLFLSILIVTRLLTGLFHELGHAIPAIMFTNDKVTVFLGSYGDVKKSKCITFGKRLIIYFRLNPLKWRGGMVRHSPPGFPIFKELLILLFGPLCSLLLASIAIYIVYSFDLNGFAKLFTLFFFLSAIFDLRNIYPNEKPILLYDGTFTYNDGQQIKRLLKFKEDKKKLREAIQLCNKENYKQSIYLFESLNPDFINNGILSINVWACIQIKDYNRAKAFYSRFISSPVFQKSDAKGYFYFGLVESKLAENELAMNYYNKSLELDSNYFHSLCNRGYTYNLFENYTCALNDFHKAIEIDPEPSYAYANRAFTKIKLGLFEDALSDINTAISIDKKNAYAYRNLGIYFLELGKYSNALEQLRIAFELDSDTHLINDYIKTVEGKLSEIKAG